VGAADGAAAGSGAQADTINPKPATAPNNIGFENRFIPHTVKVARPYLKTTGLKTKQKTNQTQQ
jgi:hypothetical protein